jgi:hypothetical protein
MCKFISVIRETMADTEGNYGTLKWYVKELYSTGWHYYYWTNNMHVWDAV